MKALYESPVVEEVKLTMKEAIAADEQGGLKPGDPGYDPSNEPDDDWV